MVPNFDAMSEGELWAFYRRYSRATRKDAEALVGDRRKGYVTLAATVANYACNKSVAMTCRLKGDIQAALVYEDIADNIYGRIPEDLRW